MLMLCRRSEACNCLRATNGLIRPTVRRANRSILGFGCLECKPGLAFHPLCTTNLSKCINGVATKTECSGEALTTGGVASQDCKTADDLFDSVAKSIAASGMAPPAKSARVVPRACAVKNASVSTSRSTAYRKHRRNQGQDRYDDQQHCVRQRGRRFLHIGCRRRLGRRRAGCARRLPSPPSEHKRR